MATIQRFEELLCWKKSRELVKEIYRALAPCRDYGFKDQIQRASVSVMSNIAEGFERGTRQEFLNYLFIAKGSAGEVRAQLYAALDVGYLNIETFKYLNNLAEQCSRLIASFIERVKGGMRRGVQYRQADSSKRPKSFVEEYMEQEGLVMTGRGVMKREDAAAQALEIIA